MGCLGHIQKRAAQFLAAITLMIVFAGGALAEGAAFRQAVAAAASQDDALSAFYKANDFKGIWTGAEDGARRAALLDAVSQAHVHGLPQGRYDPQALRAQISAATSPAARGRLDVELSRVFLRFAREIQTGALIPSRIDRGLVRKVPYRDRTALLVGFLNSDPTAFLRALPPQSAEYARLLREKGRLERLAATGGWGRPVPSGALKPGDRGAAVLALRDRLAAMGYLERSAAPAYDAALQAAVQAFQGDHGLEADGVAGSGTLTEINVAASERLKSVLVALERERWLNQPRGARHVFVNLTDFSVKIIDDGEVTFESRTVVGANNSDRRSPEFSDVMEYMVINPTWNVPRSITVKEYLPMMQRNRNAAGHLDLYDRRGRKVSRSQINFGAYNARNFPYAMKQPPSQRNALGLVKFMFPNKYNIYLHDTPSKNLFQREVRAFSHGCIRVHQPFDLAYALLAAQSETPERLFKSHLSTGRESVIRLEKGVPVHIDYRTAFTRAGARINFRRDVYGRDGAIWAALSSAGVVLGAPEG